MDPRAHSEPLRRLAACPVWDGLDGGTLVVACSGGRDSTALARAAQELLSQGAFRERFTRPPTLLLWHLDHGLRDDSPQDAAFVAALGEQLGVATLIEQVNLRERLQHEGGNLEAVARDARYDRLRKLAGKEGILSADIESLPAGCSTPVHAMTAHHLGDQAETILHHIIRGTHLAGLGGIAAEAGGYLYRPWLDLAPERLDGYLAQLGQVHCEDSTNYALDRTRNRIRQEVMPLLLGINPRAREHIAHLAVSAREARRWLAERAAQTAMEQVGMLALSRWLPLAGWPAGRLEACFAEAGFSPAALLADAAARALAAHEVDLGAGEYGLLQGWAADGAGQVKLGGWQVLWLEERLFLLQELGDDECATDDALALQLIPNQQLCCAGLRVEMRDAGAEEWAAHWLRRKQVHEEVRDFGAMLAELCAEQPSELSWHCYLPESVSLPLTLRAWREGERIELAGGGSKTLGDVFTDAKAPIALRRAWAVLADSEDRAVWLPGLAQGALMRIPAGTLPQWHLILRSGGD